MSPVLEKALTELQKCPEWEQEAIALHILEDIKEYAAEPEPDTGTIDDALWAELRRRTAASDADPSRLVPLEDVMAKLAARFGR